MKISAVAAMQEIVEVSKYIFKYVRTWWLFACLFMNYFLNNMLTET